jgi:hypothetical protein
MEDDFTGINTKQPNTYSSIAFSLFSVMILVLYGKTLSYGYYADDFIMVNLQLRHLIDWFIVGPTGPHVRPIWYLSYYLTNMFFQSALFDHAVNILLFIFSACLAYRLCLIYFNQSVFRSFITTTLWILLPWQAFPVAWISQRNDLLNYCFGFASLILLHREKYFVSFGLLLMGVFSKVTIFMLPLFHMYKTYKNKQYKYLLLFCFLFLSIFLLSAYAYFTNMDKLITAVPRDASIILKLAKYLFAYIEGVITQFIPAPFFLNGYHAILYLITLIGFYLSMTFDWNNYHSESTGIALLTIVPSCISPELRILGFSSLFIIVSIVSIVSQVKRRFLFIVFGLLFIAHCTITTYLTSSHFETSFRNPKLYQTKVNDQFPLTNNYLNTYYAKKLEFLKNVYGFIK